jgi:5'-3' exoribonuclease 1
MCSHNNNDTLSMRMSDEEIFKNIERYMDVIVNEIIKPKESIVIAVDGVAPRAKLNQQRGRRFRSARERIHSMTPTDGSNGSGVDIADDHVFDSNCITPSTEFMVKLDLFLQDMIARKLGEAGDGDGDGSETWGGVRVVYSGHGVPGEGEHKIMQHIRTERAKPTYRANQRHCLYGQDADLLMLGLATHEPHFTILREVVVFKKTGNSNANLRFTTTEDSDEEDDNSLPLGLPSVEFVIPTASKFQLLHLSVLREYLEVEFSHKHYGSPLDRERLIDDFILLTFFVGNDFLPHLPALEINENAFDVIFDAYKSLQQEKVEYIVEDGEIANFVRLEKFLSIIGEQEESILEKRALDVRIKALRVNNTLSKKQKKIQTQEIINLASVGGSNEGLLDKPSHGGTYQQKYYVDKFGNDATDLIQTDFSFSAHSIDTFVPCLVQEYVKGLIWCFKYYTKGCVSWNWYFPYHYGPMLKDVVNLEEISKKISFELSAPLLPYQQLLGKFHQSPSLVSLFLWSVRFKAAV